VAFSGEIFPQSLKIVGRYRCTRSSINDNYDAFRRLYISNMSITLVCELHATQTTFVSMFGCLHIFVLC